MLILNLSPVPAMDYRNTDTGDWLANVSACPVPEISNAFARSRIAFHVVSGLLYPAEGHTSRYYNRAWTQIAEWIQAANVLHQLSYSRFGFLGHTYPGMLDMYADPTMPHAQPGTHIELLEMDDLQVRLKNISEAAVTITRRWRAFGGLSKLRWSIVSLTLPVLKPDLPFLRLLKAGITASAAIHRWAILALNNSNISVRLYSVSISLGQGQGANRSWRHPLISLTAATKTRIKCCPLSGFIHHNFFACT